MAVNNNLIPIAIWDTDNKKLVAIADSKASAGRYIFNSATVSIAKLDYALANTGLLKKEGSVLTHNIKVKFANTEQIKLLGSNKIHING